MARSAGAAKKIKIWREQKMTCDVNGCKWNDGNGNCECDGIYISDAETGDPMCMSAEFED